MKKLLLLLIAALTVWHLYSRVDSRKLAPAVDRVTGGNVELYAPEPNQQDGAVSPGRYRCDGRQLSATVMILLQLVAIATGVLVAWKFWPREQESEPGA